MYGCQVIRCISYLSSEFQTGLFCCGDHLLTFRRMSAAMRRVHLLKLTGQIRNNSQPKSALPPVHLDQTPDPMAF
jgi:hypothetical protein